MPVRDRHDPAPGDYPTGLTLMWPGQLTLDDIMRAATDTAHTDTAHGRASRTPAEDGQPVPSAEIAGRVVDELPPGPELAHWLSVAQPADLNGFSLAGAAAAARRMTAWAQAHELALVAEMAARAAVRDGSVPVGPEGGPARVPDDAADEVALTLCMSRFGAAWWTGLAVTLAWRLPATLRALSGGMLDFSRAKLIAEATSTLDDDAARAVQDRTLPSAGRQTLGQLRAALRRAVISVDPRGAERRRQETERKARVGLFADEEGTATLSGQNLPGAQSAAAMARISALAHAMKSSGLEGGIDLLRARAFLGLLLGTLPLIPPSEHPDDPGPDDQGPDDSGSDDPGPDDPGPHGRDPDDPGPHGRDPDDRGPDNPGPDIDEEPGGAPRAAAGGRSAPDASGGLAGWPDLPRPGDIPAPGCAPHRPPNRGSPLSRGSPGPKPRGRLTVTVPWRTLAGVLSEPGNLCWLGPVTPVVAQMLARTATADPACEWRVIVTGPTGQAIAVTRVRRTGRRRRATSAAGLISQVTLTVPAGILDGIAAALALSSLDSLGELGEILARAWQSARAAAAEASSSEPTDTCDHRQASPAYRPPDRLRNLIVARDQTCRFPGCRQPACRGDLDHTVPYEAGGLTCACNLEALCRTHHRLKQRLRWQLEQRTPGVLTWTTPAGRTYSSTPDTHAA